MASNKALNSSSVTTTLYPEHRMCICTWLSKRVNTDEQITGHLLADNITNCLLLSTN